VCAPARAATPLDEAKTAFAAGKIAFERGDYEGALAQFMRANHLAPAPTLLYDIGKTYEKMARYRDAVTWFERYLEQVGPPQTDEDRKFQDELRARIALDRSTADRVHPGVEVQAPPPRAESPPPGYPPPSYPPPATGQQPYYPPPYWGNPYGYQAPYLPQLSRQQRLDNARHKRTSGIVTFSVGAALLVTGVALIADPLVRNNNNGTDLVNDTGGLVELVVGVPFAIIGPVLVGVGGANWAKGQREMDQISREPQGMQPRAMLFRLPAVSF
jgi:hypothetical protein